MVDPVSMQNIVIRSPEVARIQKVEDNASMLSSYTLAQEAQDESQKVEREVIPSPETDRYAKEENRKKKEEQDMMDGEKKGNKEKQLMVRGDKGNIVDVRV